MSCPSINIIWIETILEKISKLLLDLKTYFLVLPNLWFYCIKRWHIWIYFIFRCKLKQILKRKIVPTWRDGLFNILTDLPGMDKIDTKLTFYLLNFILRYYDYLITACKSKNIRNVVFCQINAGKIWSYYQFLSTSAICQPAPKTKDYLPQGPR